MSFESLFDAYEEQDARMVLRDPSFLTELRTYHFEETAKKLQQSSSTDHTINNIINTITDLDKNINNMAKRVRTWAYPWFPDTCFRVHDISEFCELISTQKIEHKIAAQESTIDLMHLKALNNQVLGMIEMRQGLLSELEQIMQEYCPQLQNLLGTSITAQMFEHAKTLKHLAMLPASTIQLLGAEKALFRHLKTGSKSPKYGVLYLHPYLQKMRRSEKGKAARLIANKASLAAKIDFFSEGKTELNLKEELEQKLFN